MRTPMSGISVFLVFPPPCLAGKDFILANFVMWTTTLTIKFPSASRKLGVHSEIKELPLRLCRQCNLESKINRPTLEINMLRQHPSQNTMLK